MIEATLGAECTAAGGGTAAEAYAESSPTVPIVIVTEKGVTASRDIRAFAVSQELPLDSVHFVSLGQGQGAAAVAAVDQAATSGAWVRSRPCGRASLLLTLSWILG